MSMTTFTLSKSLFSIVVALSFLFVFDLSLSNAQNKNCRVYIFAGQSNCNGAGGRVDLYPENLGNSADCETPYVYKMIPNVQLPQFDPGVNSNWPRQSAYSPAKAECGGESNMGFVFNDIDNNLSLIHI